MCVALLGSFGPPFFGYRWPTLTLSARNRTVDGDKIDETVGDETDDVESDDADDEEAADDEEG